MSRIIKVNGDYRLQVAKGGEIILDTTGVVPDSVTFGTVTIKGNLNVLGATTTTSSTNTMITDNILSLNSGDITGAGINSANNYTSGIEIYRGTSPKAQFSFYEQINWFNAATPGEQSGAFQVITEDGAQNALQLRTLISNSTSDLAFDMQGSSHALAIVNSQGTYGVAGHNLTADATNYAGLGLQPYHVPNVQFVYNYVASSYNGSGQGTALVNQLEWPLGSGGTASVIATGSSGPAGQIQFSVNAIEQGYFSTAGLTVGNVRINSDTITDIANNLILTASTGAIEVNAVLNLDNQSTPTYEANKSKLYSSSTIGPGNTGVYITNSTLQTPDELISRRRAVVMSILL